ncbi:MAG: hypothetical protein NTY75_02675 [Candidatus Shapirobacteria bacterium]|nr:hypothetical protein [Candidatus Shapirobacteria bacterium]
MTSKLPETINLAPGYHPDFQPGHFAENILKADDEFKSAFTTLNDLNGSLSPDQQDKGKAYLNALMFTFQEMALATIHQQTIRRPDTSPTAEDTSTTSSLKSSPPIPLDSNFLPVILSIKNDFDSADMPLMSLVQTLSLTQKQAAETQQKKAEVAFAIMTLAATHILNIKFPQVKTTNSSTGSYQADKFPPTPIIIDKTTVSPPSPKNEPVKNITIAAEPPKGEPVKIDPLEIQWNNLVGPGHQIPSWFDQALNTYNRGSLPKLIASYEDLVNNAQKRFNKEAAAEFGYCLKVARYIQDQNLIPQPESPPEKTLLQLVHGGELNDRVRTFMVDALKYPGGYKKFIEELQKNPNRSHEEQDRLDTINTIIAAYKKDSKITSFMNSIFESK